MNYKNLVSKYGSPLYVYDFDEITKNYELLKGAFAARKSLVCFAIKANSNLSILQHLVRLGSGFDCVSIGEVRRALLAGANPYKIIYSGVGKQDYELEEALKSEILYINLESEAEMYRLEKIAQNLGKTARISIRVNPNVDAKTHPYISTGLNENKFGVSVDNARAMYLYAKKSEFLNPVGIHFHIGSQLTDISPIHDAAKIVSDLLRELLAAQIEIKFFDIGGGIGIRYKDEKQVSLYDYAQGILAVLSGLDVTIACEPGRFIVGNAGEFITSVLYEKYNGTKRFVITDGAMNDLIRPSLYQAYHEVVAVQKEGESSLCDIVGPICESGDFLAKNVNLPNLDHGDILVIKSAGAYGFSMSSNYNTRPRPAEVAISEGKDRLIRARESFEDLVANEKKYMEE